MESSAEWVTAKPSSRLTSFIDSYVGYRMTGFAPGVHRGLPSRHMTFIVSVGPGIDVVSQTDSKQLPARYGCVLSGLQTTPALISHTGNQEGVAIGLTPLGCRVLFGMPSRALWNSSFELADIAGGAGDELWERLQGLINWSDRFAACDDVLTRLVRTDRAVAPELTRVWQTLVNSGGTASVEALSARVGWSRQHLAHRFREEFGLGPKLAARVIRFERATRMLHGQSRFATIAEVAATCGYYDQAHLNRDFAELAGCSPTAWLREELPSFQDDGAAGV